MDIRYDDIDELLKRADTLYDELFDIGHMLSAMLIDRDVDDDTDDYYEVINYLEDAKSDVNTALDEVTSVSYNLNNARKAYIDM